MAPLLFPLPALLTLTLALTLAMVTTLAAADTGLAQSVLARLSEAELDTRQRKKNQCNFQCLVLLGGLGQSTVNACSMGCNTCKAAIGGNVADPWFCAKMCKAGPFPKSLYPPDQFCLFGCVLNLCQGFCTDEACALQSGYGPGAVARDASDDECCTAAQTLCLPGGSSLPGQARRLQQARRACEGRTIVLDADFHTIELTLSSSADDICKAYAAVQSKNPPEC